MAVEDHVSLINGSLVKSHAGKLVQIWMKVEDSSSGGYLIQGTTTDKKMITVRFDSPLNQSVGGWIEVFGTSDGASINCSEIIMLNDESSEPLDEQAHNQMIMFRYNMQDFDRAGENEA